MALNFIKKFPLEVTIFKKYGNVLQPVMDKGRHEIKKISTQYGGKVERTYLLLKKGKQKIPSPDIQFLNSIMNKRQISLLQLDRFTFYPITFTDTQMLVKAPFYAMDKEGKQILDEEGNPTIQMVDRVLFDSRMLLGENNELITLPVGTAHKTYDKEHWLSDEIESASRLYRKKSFLEQYAPFLIIGVCAVSLAIILYVGIQGYAKITETLVGGMNAVANALVKATANVAQVAAPAASGIKPPY